MDFKKLAEKGAMNAGLSTSRSKEIASEIASVILQEIEKEKKAKKSKKGKSKKDITEIENTYK